MKFRFLVFTIIAITLAMGCCGMSRSAKDKTISNEKELPKFLADMSAGAPMEMRAATGQMDDTIGPSSGGTEIPNAKAYDLTFFENYGVNPFISTEDENFSTFGMDVDTASYTIARRYIMDGNIPDKDSIRTEEFINYFDQKYPDSDEVFSIITEGAKSKFGQPNYHLLKIGIKTAEITQEQRKPANMVFVVDVSGSMEREDRLEQVKKSMRSLAECLKEGDEIGLVVYGSEGRVISELTSERSKIFNAIDQLIPSGSTNAEEGLNLAYNMMEKYFDAGKINRIILCSDGVANVGTTDPDKFLKSIKEQAKKGITLTCLGFGMGNYNDVFLEKLANHGDGNYYYIDSPTESDRVFGKGATSMLQVLASDAKIQVEFNPETVDRYRLLGYENRRLNKEDFEDDTVDAGEVGVGQTVTALYEMRIKDDALSSPESSIGTVRIRYFNLETKKIETNEKSVSVQDMARDFDSASPRYRFSAAVAECSEILKKSYWAKDGSFDDVLAVAEKAYMDSDLAPISRMTDEMEFMQLVRKAKEIESGKPEPGPNGELSDDVQSNAGESDTETVPDRRVGIK
jgi:Ca-activated chloride channel family protein